MIEDKEKLIDELEEHLSQVYFYTPKSPFRFISREIIAIYLMNGAEFFEKLDFVYKPHLLCNEVDKVLGLNDDTR